MPRACRICSRVVAEAAFCPFCSEPTVEHIPIRRNRSDAMTIRRQFEQRSSWIAFVTFFSCLGPSVAIGLTAFSQFITQAYSFMAPFFLLAMLLFLVVGMITIVYGRTYAFPCPRCQKNINLNQIGRNVRYCPFCGLDLDVEIDPDSDEPTGFLKEEWRQQGLEIKKTAIQLSPGMQKGNTAIQLPPGKEEKGTA